MRYPSDTLYPGPQTWTSKPAPPAPPPIVAPPPPQVDAPGPMHDRWSFVIGPPTGERVTELAAATDRKITFKLTEPSEASCSLDGTDPAAAMLAELGTDLTVFRRRTYGATTRQILFRGRIGNVSDNIDETRHTVSVPAIDYREVLKRRHLMHGMKISWDGYDQAWIAYGLIAEAQKVTGGDYGIVNGAAVTGQTRTRAYELGDNIGERIQELSEVINGFDWDIAPAADGTLTFRVWYPQRGTDRGVVLELGGAARTLQRSVDSKDYANAIRLTGTAPEGGDGEEPPPEERYAADLGSGLQGRWDGVYNESITTAANLKERADWRIAEQQVVRPSYTLNLAPGWWDGPDHLWLGDPVRLVIYRGRLAVDTVLRVQEISVSIADTGDEQVAVTLGAPRPDYRRRAAEIDRLLSTLERR